MKFKGTIIQIVTWEKREEYFDVDAWDGEYDLIVIDNYKRLSLKNAFKNFWKNDLFTPQNFMEKRGISLWIKRPHDYKLGDAMVVSVDIIKAMEVKT